MDKYFAVVIFVILAGLTACSGQQKRAAQTNYNYQEKEIPVTINGENIFGMAYLPENVEGKIPVVILSHGYSGTYKNGETFARAIAAQGYAAYSFDFRGGSPRSRSDGNTTRMSIFTEKADLEAVLSAVQEWDFIDKENIFLLGESQGGMVSTLVAADRPDLVKGMILIYPAFVIADDARKNFGSIDHVPDTFNLMGMNIGRAYYEDLFDFDPYSHINRYGKDVLIIHGDRDDLVDISYSQRAVEVYPSAELKIIKGAGHGFRGKDEEQATDYIVEYLKKKRD